MVSFFETTIRCLGGLVTAYELSGDPVLLEKATDLGERLGKVTLALALALTLSLTSRRSLRTLRRAAPLMRLSDC